MEDDYSVPHLPMDIMCQIPLLISDPATLVRLASSCKFFRDLIKKSTFLDHLRRRHRDHGFTPSLLLGFFYQDNKRSHSHLWQHHTDKNRCLAPSFVRTSELSQFVGSKAARNAVKPLSLETFIPGVGASLNFYKPIASQTASWLSAAASMAPMVRRWMCYAFATLSLEKPSNLPPNHYALFVTNNVDLYGRRSQSFFLIAIWIKNAKFFTSQRYSSKTGIWTASLQNPELMPGLYLVSSSAAASSSVVRWLCGSWKQWTLTHVATLHIGMMELSYLELPPEATRNKEPLLANSADGGLLLLFVQGFQMLLWKHNSALGRDTSSWVLSERIDLRSSLPLRVVKLGINAKIRLEMFRGKSGTAVLWVFGEGLFLFSLSDRSMRKIDSERLTDKYYLCPYEIDWLSCLAITNLVLDGSLLLDVQREKAQDRWRALMGKNLAMKGAS